MIKAGVGFSLDPRAVRAARQAATLALERGKISRANAVILFTTATFRSQHAVIVKTLEKLTGTSNIVGSSALGIITNDGEVESEPGLGVMVIESDRMFIQPFVQNNLRGRCLEAGQRLGEAIRPSLAGSSLLMVLTDTFAFEPEPFFRGLEQSAGFLPVIGGGSSEQGSQCHETFQIYGRRLISDSITGLLFTGNFRHEITFSQACQPLGEPMIVTQAHGNTIMELAGRPAYAAFCDLFEEPVDFPTATSMICIGLPIDLTKTRLERGQYLVRNIIDLDPVRGTITVASPVIKGQVVSFTLRDPLGARQDMEQTLKDLAERYGGDRPSFALYFDCCARGSSLYGKTGVDVELFNRYFGGTPILGFFTYSEIAPIQVRNYLHNYSGVLVLVSEEPPAHRESS